MGNSIYSHCISICVLFNTAQTANSNLLSIRFCPTKQPSGLYASCICEFPVCAAAVRCTVVSLAAASYMRMTSYVSRFGWSRLEARRASQTASQPNSQRASLWPPSQPSHLALSRLNLRPSMLQYYVLPAFGLDRLQHKIHRSVSVHL